MVKTLAMEVIAVAVGALLPLHYFSSVSVFLQYNVPRRVFQL